jgi:hypothetical protein
MTARITGSDRVSARLGSRQFQECGIGISLPAKPAPKPWGETGGHFTGPDLYSRYRPVTPGRY